MADDKWDYVGGVYRKKPKPKTSFGEIVGGILFIGFLLFLISVYNG